MGEARRGTVRPADWRSRLPRPLAHLASHERAGRVTRYLAGSVICTVISTVTFLGVFGFGLLGSRASSLTASAGGSVAGYWLNRNWTWGRRGVGHVGREMVPYWVTVVTTALAAAVVTGWVNGQVRDLTDDHNLRAVADAAAYLGTYGFFFIAKYVVFNRLFAAEPRRDQPEALAADDLPARAPAGSRWR